MEAYLDLVLVTVLPAIAAVILEILFTKTRFRESTERKRQAICGIVFGLLAVLGTEFGIPINGAVMNARDGAVVTAGLMFGGTAGVIAGVIGGAERYFAVYWGAGQFTQIACSVSTAVAGIASSAIRKFLLRDERPSWILSLAIGTVLEVFHLTMVFLTNMGTPLHAIDVVKICTIPMLLANGISVLLASMALNHMSGNLRVRRGTGKIRLSQMIQRSLLAVVVIAFAATSVFVFVLQHMTAIQNTDRLLEIALNETADDIQDETDRSLLNVTRYISNSMYLTPMSYLADEFGVSEINRVDENGIISDSTNSRFIGYDIASGERSAEFLCLLGDTEAYVQEYGPISPDSTVFRKYAGVKMTKGFLLVGYDQNGIQEVVSQEVVDISRNRHIGERGYVLVLDAALNVVSAPENMAEKIGQILLNQETVEELEEGSTFRMNLNGEECFCRFRTAEGYTIVSVQPCGEALQMRDTVMYINSFIEILVFAVLFLVICILLRGIVVNQLQQVNGSLSRITDGDLDEVVDVRSTQEFSNLSDDINSTVDTLKRYIQEASARIDKELEFARKIQHSVLPVSSVFTGRTDFEIDGSMSPAKEVGGDFYDFYVTGDHVLHFLVADVSGKGIPAAMFMMQAKVELKGLTESGLPIGEVFTRGNSALCEGNEAEMFVTAWQGGLDLETGKVSFVNAGHNPPLICHAGGKFEYLRARSGLVLAGMDGVRYRPQELQLVPGDILFLYTDGITEATDACNRLFGEDRLLKALNEYEYTTPSELCAWVRRQVDDFVGDAPQFDDMTMVALRYLG